MMIRPFQPADLPAIRQIAIEAFDGVSIDQAIERIFGQIHGHDWQWRKARHIDADVARDAAGIFVATGDAPPEGEPPIVGFVTSACDDEAGIGVIPNLCIAAGYRGQGIGRLLLEHVLDHFRQRGLTHARIETLAHNEVGYGLYTSLGFAEVARQVHFAMDLQQHHSHTQSKTDHSE